MGHNGKSVVNKEIALNLDVRSENLYFLYSSCPAHGFAGKGALPEVPQRAQTVRRTGIQIHPFGKKDVYKLSLLLKAGHR